jgi:ABC-type amino acid transport substrate-binding protein
LEDTDADPFHYLYSDSVAYTKFMNDRLKVMKRIERYYEKNPSSRFVDAVMPFLVQLGQFGVDLMSEEAKRLAQAGSSFPPTIPGTEETMEMKAMKEAKKYLESIYPPDVAINKVRDFVKNILPKKYTSYEEAMKALLKSILDAHPTWRVRMQKDFEEKYIKEINELTQEIDNMIG